MYSVTQTQFKHKKFYHKTLIRFFLENALNVTQNFHTILAILFWLKYKNITSPNIKVACDMLQTLCDHKKLSNIEESGRGTGGEPESLIFFYFCHNLRPGLSENEKKSERIGP